MSGKRALRFMSFAAVLLVAALVAQCVAVPPEETASVPSDEELTNLPWLPQAPTPMPVTGLILYESGGALYRLTVDAQGHPLAEPQPVAVPLAEDEQLRSFFPSPNKRQVVFFTHRPQAECDFVYVLAPLDWRIRPLFAPGSGPGLQGPGLCMGTKFFGWHPGNRHIIYWDGEDIWLHDVDADASTLLPADLAAWAELPYAPLVDDVAFSPDGARFMVSFTLTGSGGELWVADADGSDPFRLYKGSSRLTGLMWPRDGQVTRPGGDEVVTSDVQTLAQRGKYFFYGNPSPDRRYAALTEQVYPLWRARIADTETGAKWDLAVDASRSTAHPAWSPDGQWVVFLDGWGQEAAELWVARRDGSEMRQLTFDGQPKNAGPVWLLAPGGCACRQD